MKIGLEFSTKRGTLFNFPSRILSSTFLSVLVAILFAMTSAPAYADAGASSCDVSWAYRKAITIDHTKMQVDLTDFPVLITWSSDTDLAELADHSGNNGNGGNDEDSGNSGNNGNNGNGGNDEDSGNNSNGGNDEDNQDDEGAQDNQDDEDIPYITDWYGSGGGTTLAPLTTNINVLGKLTTAWVSSSGELLESIIVTDADGRFKLRFDKGSKIVCGNNKAPQRIVLKLGDSLPPPSDAIIIGPIYELNVYTSKDSSTPSPVIISPPASMVLDYDPEELPENTSSIFVAYYDEEQGWTPLKPPNGFVAEVGTAVAQVSHFTSFAVMAQLAAPVIPARFEVRNLDINPIEVMPGESVTVSAWLINIGGLSGEHIIKVSMECRLETSQVTRLSPGQSQKITFTVTPAVCSQRK